MATGRVTGSRNMSLTQQSDWKQCFDWLVGINLIPSDHVLMTSSPTLVNLAQLLSDGVLLCLLLNKLKPNVIDRKSFSQRPQSSEYICKRNIRVFLEACKSGFCLKEGDLFEVQDLRDMKQFEKVIRTISKLSQTSEAKSCGYVPFSTDSRTSSTEYAAIPEQILSSLSGYDSHNRRNSVFNEDENIYENVVNALRTSTSSQSTMPTSKSPSAKPKREHIIQEIVDSEKKYIDILFIIRKQFMEKLAKDMLHEEFLQIFPCIRDLHVRHTNFHEDLCRVITGASDTKTVADCFISFKEHLLMYGQYCSNLSTAQNLLISLCQTKSSFKKKLQACEFAASGGRFTLQNILTAPVQRVLKYHLLLKELSAEGKDDQEKRSLEQALSEMLEVADYVNEATRDTESLLDIDELESKIFELVLPMGTHLHDYGHLIHDGELRVKTISDTRAAGSVSRYVFLFDKLMLLCRQRNDQYDYQELIMLKNYKLDTNEYTFTSCSFTLDASDRQSSYKFTTKSDEERLKWTKSIETACDNERPPFACNEIHNFVQTTFNEPTYCDVCRKLLKGVFFQGYKCSKTNQVVHKACIFKATKISNPPRPVPTTRTPVSTSSQLKYLPVRAIGRVIAETDYTGHPLLNENLTSLVFKKGDVFDLLENTGDWWKGRMGCSDNSVVEGYFPAKSCRLLRSLGRTALTPAGSLDSSESAAPLPAPRSTRLERSNTVPTRPAAALYDVPRSILSELAENEENLESYPWFVGQMVRTEATKVLRDVPNGTFLVRHSTDRRQKGQDVISVKYDIVQHIRIELYQTDGKLFIDERLRFNTLPELILHYQETSLETSFPDVPTTLLWPYKEAVATSTSM